MFERVLNNMWDGSSDPRGYILIGIALTVLTILIIYALHEIYHEHHPFEAKEDQEVQELRERIRILEQHTNINPLEFWVCPNCNTHNPLDNNVCVACGFMNCQTQK